ncbi:MAG: MFS transporter, partial [Rhodospirillales bacterium]|nr:MFS transporter [Rhodospirillales bacterium]
MALVCGALVLSLAMGIRQTFGLFLAPMSVDLGIGRETFALALAIQNLFWGAVQPLSGMIADKIGSVRVLVFGTVAYCCGLILMSGATNAADLHLGAGLL